MDKNKKKKNAKKADKQDATERSLEVIAMRDDYTDPFGSYTGIADDPYEVPVQDADDL
ncbi:MAG: hypothetical protein J1E39_09225 [Eubacterium sp.]|nr:hypothetical protein [Eubacterium sp.]